MIAEINTVEGRTLEIARRVGAKLTAVAAELLTTRRGVTPEQLKEIAGRLTAETVRIAQELGPNLNVEIDAAPEAFDESARELVGRVFAHVLGAPTVHA
jgi:hypothetical protein